MIVTDLPPQNHIVVTEQMPNAVGVEGRLLREEWLKARDHWEDQFSFGRDSGNQSPDAGVKYPSFSSDFTVEVTYRFAGKISPIPYDWDD